MGFAACIAWGLTEVLARMQWTPSHSLHESALLRDQVCLSNNKEGGFITHPLFAIYKLDPLDHTAHLSPPPSRRLATSIIIQGSSNKVRMRTLVTLVMKTGFIQFEWLFTFWVPKLRLREWLATASTKGYSYFKRSGLHIAKRGCVMNILLFCVTILYKDIILLILGCNITDFCFYKLLEFTNTTDEWFKSLDDIVFIFDILPYVKKTSGWLMIHLFD